MVVPTGARDWGWRFESADRAYYVPPTLLRRLRDGRPYRCCGLKVRSADALTRGLGVMSSRSRKGDRAGLGLGVKG